MISVLKKGILGFIVEHIHKANLVSDAFRQVNQNILDLIHKFKC